MKRAFVTGGTGFVGSHLVEYLVENGYDEVRCLIRSDEKWLKGLNIQPVKGDMQNLDALKFGCENADVVFHIAGLTRAKSWDEFKHANVDGTENLLKVLKENKNTVKRVLITSSQAAVGPSKIEGREDDNPSIETDPLNPISMYGKSKAEMEGVVAKYHDVLPITIVRPPAVYGPRESDIFTFFQAVNKGLCPIIGDGKEAKLSLVHVSDLVAGMVQVAESEKTIGETYFISSDEYYSWDQIREATLAAMDRRAVTIHVPERLVGIVGAISENIGNLLGTYPALNKEKAREIQATWRCSIKKAQADVGYQQKMSLKEGIKQTILWYKQNDWL